MNWHPKKSAWNELQQQKAKRRAMVQDFQQRNEALASQLSNAYMNSVTGTVENVTRTAIDRIQKQVAAKREEALKRFDKLA